MKIKKQIVAFGIGIFFENNKRFFDKDEIVAFFDNCVEAGTCICKDGKEVYNPENYNAVKFDYIVLMSTYADEMREQLISYGIKKNKILFFESYLFMKYGNTYKVFNNTKVENNKKTILFMAPDVYGTGAANAMIMAAKVLSNHFNVAIAASTLTEEDCKRLRGIANIVIQYRAIYSIDWKDNLWLKNFDYIICNTVYLLHTYISIRYFTNSILWLHDPRQLCKYERNFVNEDDLNTKLPLNIYSVSEYSKNVFLEEFKISTEIKLLPYGIIDNKSIRAKHARIIFANIGAIYKTKGQDIFLKAINKLPKTIIEECEFYFIGKYAENSQYFESVKEISNGLPNIVFTGEKTKEEMHDLYSQIDVVACTSREDMLPTVVAEGMMNHLLVITSDRTGFVHYINDDVNGFIFNIDDVNTLTKKMIYIVKNFDKLDKVRERARYTYEKNFTLTCFYKNLCLALKECEKNLY